MKYIYVCKDSEITVKYREIICKIFTANTFGSLEKALEKARSFRDYIKPLTDHIDTEYKGNILDSELPGVYCRLDRNKKGRVWVTNWTVGNRRYQRSFHVSAWGHKEAKMRAVLAREQAVGPYPFEAIDELRLIQKYFKPSNYVNRSIA